MSAHLTVVPHPDYLDLVVRLGEPHGPDHRCFACACAREALGHLPLEPLSWGWRIPPCADLRAQRGQPATPLGWGERRAR